MSSVIGKRGGASKAVMVAVILLLAAIAGVSLYLLTSSSPSSDSCSSTGTQAPAGSAIQVSIYSGAVDSSNPPGYAPDSLTLVLGVNNTVTWTNNDAAHHTVTSTSASACAGFDSGNLNQGDTYTHTFTVPGTYTYHCSYHGWMTGIIVVRAGT